MKNNYLLLAPAVFILTSCSNEEIVNLNREDEVRLQASVRYSTTTRGTETTTVNLKKFYVAAIGYDDNNYGESMYKETTFGLFEKKNDGYFASDPPLKWSKDIKTMRIYAFGYKPKGDGVMMVPNTEGDGPFSGAEIEITPDQQTINNFSPRIKVEDQIDLVVAKGSGNILNTYEPISLTFDHLLTEVQVVARCGSKSHRVLVKGVKLCNMRNRANYNYSSNDNPWTFQNDVVITDYEIRYDTPINLNNTDYNHDHKGVSEAGKLYHDISKSEGEIGYAMPLPQTLTTWNATYEYFNVSEGKPVPAGKTKTSAQCIAVLIRIDALEGDKIMAPKFPIEEADKVPGTGGYGWAYIPIHLDKYPSWQMGYRYVYHLDFTDAAGYNESGDQILTQAISFTATLNEWTSTDITKP